MGLRLRCSGCRFSPPRRSTVCVGMAMPFSAMNIRTRCGLGPTESYSFIVFAPRFCFWQSCFGGGVAAFEQTAGPFVKPGRWASAVVELVEVAHRLHDRLEIRARV